MQRRPSHSRPARSLRAGRKDRGTGTGRKSGRGFSGAVQRTRSGILRTVPAAGKSLRNSCAMACSHHCFSQTIKQLGFQRGSTRALDAARSSRVSSAYSTAQDIPASVRHNLSSDRAARLSNSALGGTGGDGAQKATGKTQTQAKRCVFSKSGCEMASRRLVVRVGSWCGVCGTGLCPSCPSCCGHTLRGRVRAAAGKVGLASPLPLVSKMRHVILRTGCLSQTLIRSQQILTYPTP